MKNIFKEEQLKTLGAYPKEVVEVIAETIIILDENYEADRSISDLGGYILIVESEEDIADIKANITKGLLEEYTDVIKSDEGIDYYSSLFLLSDDYSVVVFSSKELHEMLLGTEL